LIILKSKVVSKIEAGLNGGWIEFPFAIPRKTLVNKIALGDVLYELEKRKWTLAEQASVLNAKKGTIQKWRKQLGIPPRKQGAKKRNMSKEAVIARAELIEKGLI